MKRFNVTLTQKSFQAEALNIGANNLTDLANTIAQFCKETVNLHNKLAAAKVLKQTTRIKIGQAMDIKITYVEDDTTIPVSLRNFGRFVNDNGVETISSAINNIATYQEKVGHLFSVVS